MDSGLEKDHLEDLADSDQTGQDTTAVQEVEGPRKMAIPCHSSPSTEVQEVEGP